MMDKKACMAEIKKLKASIASLESMMMGGEEMEDKSEDMVSEMMEDESEDMESGLDEKAGKKAALAAMLKKKAY